MFTNGAGYTVSQGYGAYNELIGYGHGVIDAELAVRMAKDWHSLDQDSAAGTERTFSTFYNGFGTLLAGEQMPAELGLLVIPGGIGSPAGAGFVAHWNEYFADDPFSSPPLPQNTRGSSYVDFKVPVNQQINVEWVEVKISLSGPASDLDFLKINLTSPNGMQSELNHYYADPNFAPLGFQDDPGASPIAVFDPAGDLNTTGDTFVWTFATNRSWGESTNGAVIIDPLTGEPVAGPTNEFDPVTGDPIPKPIFRDWELHLENWSNSAFSINGIEIVWHGKPIVGGSYDPEWTAEGEGWQVPTAQRIQGFVGVDTDLDDEFSGIDPNVDNEWNNRYIQEAFVTPGSDIRATDLTRRLLDDFQDNNNNGVFDDGDVREQEPYAANILVQAFRFTTDSNGNDIVEDQPVAQFLTGADGNYYFDLVPGNYMIRIVDRNDNPGTAIDDPNTPAGYLQHYKDEWRITSDWFYAPDREAPTPDGKQGEVIYNNTTKAPEAFRFGAGEPRIPMAVQNINFLLKPQATPANNIIVSGVVYADVNENAAVDTFDSGAGGMRVYHDVNRNGSFDAGETYVFSNPDGSYSLTLPASAQNVFVVGVDLQQDPGWAPTLTGGNQVHILASPGDVLTSQNFFLNPPDDPLGTGLGNITGFIFSDLDSDGIKDSGETGIGGLRVFIDLDADGAWDANEASVFTGSNGGYFFSNLAAGSYRIDVQIENEGGADALYAMTSPVAGSFTVNLLAGQTKTGVAFGLHNRAERDWGDLPDSYGTTAGSGGVSHFVASHFRLGSTVDGEVDGTPTGDASADTDDGIVILGDGLLHPGENIIEVTVAGVGGTLSGWIDWDNLGSFDADDRLTFIDAVTGEVLGEEADLTPGTHKLKIIAPSGIQTGVLAARFRWGEVGSGDKVAAFIGEVEDYYLPSSAVVVAPSLPGDFNNDGNVNSADYVLFRKKLGSGSSLPNSTNPNGPVVAADYDLWKQNFGRTLSGSGGGGGSSEDASTTVPSAPVESLSLVPSVSDVTPSASVIDTTPEAAPVAEATFSFSPIYASFSVAATPSFDFTSAADETISESVSVEAQPSTSDVLLLFDQALAEMDDAIDAPVADRSNDNDEDYSDLAVAAVFDDESTWWSL